MSKKKYQQSYSGLSKIIAHCNSKLKKKKKKKKNLYLSFSSLLKIFFFSFFFSSPHLCLPLHFFLKFRKLWPKISLSLSLFYFFFLSIFVLSFVVVMGFVGLVVFIFYLSLFCGGDGFCAGCRCGGNEFCGWLWVLL